MNFELPSRKTDEYRYTDLKRLEKTQWTEVSGSLDISALEAVSDLKIRKLKDLSEAEKQSLFQSVEKDPSMELLLKANWEFSKEGVLVEVRDGSRIPGVLEIIHTVSSGKKDFPFLHPTVFFKVGKNSALTILEKVVVQDGIEAAWVNPVTAFFIGPEAAVEYAKIDQGTAGTNHTASVLASVSEKSVFHSFTLGFGSSVQRHNTLVTFKGSQGQAHLRGLSLCEEGDHMDHYCSVDHAVPDCTSRQEFKGIVADKARSVFFGRVIMRKDAQRSDSRQINKNLLLGDRAEVDTRPQLEISADDVKASHGATVGQIDPEEVFYLQSRGIRPDDAVAILARGFAEDVINHVVDLDLRKTLLKFAAGKIQNLAGRMK